MPSESPPTQPGRHARDGRVRAGVLALAGVAMALALGVGLGQWSGAGGPAPGSTGAAASEAQALGAALAEEREAREELEERLQALELRMAQVELGGPLFGAPQGAATRGAQAAVEEPRGGAGAEEPGAEPPNAGPGGSERPWFDEQKLVEGGLDPSDASRLKDAWEEVQLGRLYLSDRAAREGWSRTLNHRVQQQSMERALRQEVGDEDYDWILFATGQPNRVLVRGVLDSSPAADSGLQVGDVILSYGGERVFRPRELKQATTEGAAGESVRVEVVRRGEPVSVYVPRGPLGALLRTERMAPREG